MVDIINEGVLGAEKLSRQKIHDRISRLEEHLHDVNHPSYGMGAKGFHPDQIAEAIDEIEEKIDFYMDMLESLGENI